MNAAEPCPDLQHLRQLLDEQLSADEQDALSRHLERCPTCQSTLEGLAAGKHTWTQAREGLCQDDTDPHPGLERAVQMLAGKAGEETQGEPGATTENLDFL